MELMIWLASLALLWSADPGSMGRIRRPVVVLALSISSTEFGAALVYLYVTLFLAEDGWPQFLTGLSLAIAVLAMVIALASGARRREFVSHDMWRRWLAAIFFGTIGSLALGFAYGAIEEALKKQGIWLG
jgi:hypothetical protein